MRLLKLAVVAAAALACARGDAAAAAAGRPESGGKMSGVSVKRLGKVVPGERTVRGRPEQVDAAPIVLWSRGEVAAVVLHRSHVDGHDVVEELAPIPESVTGAIRGASALRLESRTRIPEDGGGDRGDGFQARSAVTADLDGDGVEELVVARRQGGVELAPWKGGVVRLSGPSGKASVATYTPVGTQVARLGSKAVVHLLFRRDVRDDGASAGELARIGAGEPYALVRADAAGLTRVKLELAPVREVLAVGAINRAGSSAVDEVFALYRKDDGEEVWLSRHRPDGAAVGTPRKVYAPIEAGGEWQVTFLPQSGVAVATGSESSAIYFLTPEAPANWVQAVDVKAIVGDAVKGFLGVADAGSKPKAIFRHQDAIYAVDAGGTFHVVTGGTFEPSKIPAPFQRLPDGSRRGTAVIPSAERGDEYLVVRSHAGGLQRVEHDELMKRADLHLDPAGVARERRRAEPSLEDDDVIRDRLVKEEQEKRGLKEPLRSVAEWQRLLPDSYATVVKDRQAGLDATLGSRLLAPIDRPSLLDGDRYRDPEGLRKWLASLSSGPEAKFEVVRRGAVVQSFRFEAHYGGASSVAARSLVEWRTGPAGTVVVTTAVLAGEKRETQPGVYVVRAGTGTR